MLPSSCVVELRGYVDEKGNHRFATWFDGLDSAAAVKVTIALARIGEGNFSNVKSVGAGMSTRSISGRAIAFTSGKTGIESSSSLAVAQRNGNNAILKWQKIAGPTISGARNQEMQEMPLTHDFKETVRARAQRDPIFRKGLLREAVECILNGDLTTGKAVLRDYVNATVGFQGLEKRTDIPAKSLMRMLGPKGSPSAANLSSILAALQKSEGVHFELALKS